MPVSERDLAKMSRGKQPPVFIDDDRKCLKCGYSLRGLKTDGKCPECGRPIKGTRKYPSFADQMTAAPFEWIQMFAVGCLLLAVGLTAISGSTLMYAFASDHERYLLGVMVGGVLAFIGAVIVTRPRPVTKATTAPPALEWYWERTLARFSQGAWTLGAGLCYAATRAPMGWGGAAALDWLGIGVFALAIAGLLPLGMVLCNLTYWASDTNLAYRWRIVALTLPFASLLVLAILSRGIFFVFGGVWGTLLVLASTCGVILLPIGHGLLTFWQTWWMARWVVFNNQTAEMRDQVAKERFEKARAAADAERSVHGTSPAAGGNRAGSSQNQHRAGGGAMRK